ncbi:MAG TPA: alpha/beta hydrolase [Candidatus Sulfotelmatobacter sp.]|jgi:predicted alpha/beta hydrolase family esterase|nr:alpha/beta hydrolase [Candidatus Sulfotelmatobacter sp.]
MKNAFIIHGAYGNPNDNWIPWLKKELEACGYIVTVPKFPTPEGQSLNSWLKVFEKFKGEINEETIMIGHSIGATFILSLLKQREEPINSVFLVSGFISDLGKRKFDKINNSFYEKSFNWSNIRKNCFYIFHGENDPYVSMKKAKDLATELHLSVIKIKNGGHLNTSSGFTKFDLLLEKIKSNC